jgi:signal transduction histidine kinase
VPKDRLTRHELSWLLAQEARGAAHALREGVTQLKQPGPTIESRVSEAPPVETNLDALDDAINMLSALNSANKGKARRGRIDLAALLYEVAPGARIAIEPGAGTEVFGEESDMRRMFHLLVNQSDATMTGSDGPAEVTIRRQGEWVRIRVELGPDTLAAAELERRWLSRMATRYGGWVELEGGTQSIFLPADGASDQREVVELRKELEQAQQLGEAYARELASVVAAGDTRSELPTTPPERREERLELLQSTALALQRSLKHWFDGLRADTASFIGEAAEASPLAHRLSSGSELLFDLALVTECRVNETPSNVDMVELAHEALSAVEQRAARHDVSLEFVLPPKALIETRPSQVRVMLRALLHHALHATPRGGMVRLSLIPTELGLLVTVEDGGPTVPEASRADVLQHRVDPASFGRPAGVALLVADAVGNALGGTLAMREGTGSRTELWIVLRNRAS